MKHSPHVYNLRLFICELVNMFFLCSRIMEPSTSLHYWLRWEVAMCCLSVLACLGFSAYLVWRYEGPSSHSEPDAEGGEADKARGGGVVY